MLTGWCMACGLRYACVEDWQDHQGAHVEDGPPGSAWRLASPHQPATEDHAWRDAG